MILIRQKILFSFLIILISFNLTVVLGGKCKKSAEVLCNDVFSISEIADEFDESWRSVKISSRVNGSFAMDFTGMKLNNERSIHEFVYKSYTKSICRN